MLGAQPRAGRAGVGRAGAGSATTRSRSGRHEVATSIVVAAPTAVPTGATTFARASTPRRRCAQAGGDARRRRRVLALFVGLDRQAEGHGARARQPALDRRALREADPRHHRGRRRVLGGEAVLRLRPRQRADVPALGRRDGRADGRTADARRVFKRWRGATRIGRPSSSACRPLRGHARVAGSAAARRGRAARVLVGGRSAAARRSASASRAHFGCHIIDGIGSTEMLHIFLSNRPGDVRYGTTGRPVTATRSSCATTTAPRHRRPNVGDLYIKGPSARADVLDESREEPRDLPGRLDADRRQVPRATPTATTSTRAAATTC